MYFLVRVHEMFDSFIAYRQFECKHKVPSFNLNNGKCL